MKLEVNNQMVIKLSTISSGIMGKNRILTDIAKDVESILGHKNEESSRTLEIASDKDPVFLSFLARENPESYFAHFKDDNIRYPKVHPHYDEIGNLDIIYSKKALKKVAKNKKFDVVAGFFTLHELNNPRRSLEKTKPYLNDNGKLIIIDYDLGWFNQVVSEQNWDKETAKREFSKYVFNTRNEGKVLGMKDGEPWNNSDVEAECMANHTRWGPEKYALECNAAGYEQISLKSYPIDTPWGEKPKMFLYVGRKVIKNT